MKPNNPIAEDLADLEKIRKAKEEQARSGEDLIDWIPGKGVVVTDQKRHKADDVRS